MQTFSGTSTLTTTQGQKAIRYEFQIEGSPVQDSPVSSRLTDGAPYHSQRNYSIGSNGTPGRFPIVGASVYEMQRFGKGAQFGKHRGYKVPRRLPPLVRDGDDSASSVMGSSSKKHVTSVLNQSEEKKETILTQHESVEELMIGQLRSVLNKTYLHEQDNVIMVFK